MALAGLQLAALGPETLRLIKGPPDFGNASAPPIAATIFEYSPDGSVVATCSGPTVTLVESSNGRRIASFSGDESILYLAFSPSGTYLTTYERPNKELANAHRNLKVWDAKKGVTVTTFHKKGISKDAWPAIQFSADEGHLFHLITNAVNVHSSRDNFAQAIRKVEFKGVTQFCISPGKDAVLAAFVPETRSNPAAVQIMEWGSGAPAMRNRKSFFRAQQCKFKWNSSGTHVLVQSLCDYDATNQSYFGESKLYYLSADGKLDLAVPLDKDGSVLDVAWNPDGQTFVVVYGTMPSSTCLYDLKAKAIYKLASGPYNTVKWSPHGRFIMLAGFGNLPGDIQLFDKKADNACKPMGGCRSECSVTCEWSPCGRYIMTAATAPRMRVDNRISVFTYYGHMVANEAVDVLYDARWRPAAPGAYPDRAQSPERLKEVAQSRKQGVNLTVAEKPEGYVPPHLRGRGGAPARKQVEGMEGLAGAGRVKGSGAGSGGADIGVVGAGSLSKSARKRANKAKKTPSQSGSVDGSTRDEAVEAAHGLRDVQLADQGAAGGVTVPAEPQDPAKRLRNLRKRLAKIDAAKEKQAQGSDLTPEQLENIAAEASVKEEMRSLGATDV